MSRTGFKGLKNVFIPFAAVLLSACASAPPPSRYLTAEESAALILQKAGSTRASVPLYTAYETLEEMESENQPFGCNAEYKFLRVSYLELRPLAGNEFEGRRIDVTSCADNNYTESPLRGRFDKNHVYLFYPAAQNSPLVQYSFAGHSLRFDGVYRMRSGVAEFTPSSDGKTVDGTRFKLSLYVPAAPRPERSSELKAIAQDYSTIASARVAERDARRAEERREEQRQAAAVFNAFVGTFASEMAKTNADIERGNANLARASAALNEERQRQARLDRLEEETRKRIASQGIAGQSTGSAARQARPSGQPSATLAQANTSAQQRNTAAEQAAAQKQRDDAARESKRKTEAAAREREEERRRQVAEAEEQRRRQKAEADQRAREQEVANYLERMRAGIRLAAKSCGKDDIRINGNRPGGKKVLELVDVHYVGHCPGQVRFTGELRNYIGDGLSCVGSDMRSIDLPCKPEEARFVVERVTRTN
ncbi:hypothetical protein [Massilia sp. ST3]|uniref:hypothetical protein n=1 Tax=Massilia sp. ST3 TaxID=2824903 RepID=UPI001B83D828|nr:hypothetical protein [Massilia sp. ST3]MBQ5948241.1 hypothetical protein [Massilia sp. ST3]